MIINNADKIAPQAIMMIVLCSKLLSFSNIPFWSCSFRLLEVAENNISQH